MSDPHAQIDHLDADDVRVGVTPDLVLDPEYAVVAARAAHDKGGTDILVLQVGDVLAITDYFVIVSASNPRLVRAIVQDVEDQVRRAGGPSPIRIEGLNEAEWVLSDFGTFIVHVFHHETRRYYELERLWSDVPVVDWSESTTDGAEATG